MDYETIAFLGVGLTYLTARFYDNRKRRNIIKRFSQWVEGDFRKTAEELQSTSDKFRDAINNRLEIKLNKQN